MNRTEAGSRIDRRLFFLLHRAHRALSAFAAAGLYDSIGISVAQLTTLMYVSKHAGCSLTELADLLDLNKSAVTGLVQRMEGAGTLRRAPNPDDGRGSRLYVTPKGEALRERARPLIRRLNAQLCEGFSDEEMETVFRFLNEVVRRFGLDDREEDT
jgi:MarR family transcriptional regulator, organic hydroperoxide resistance regulator